MAERRPLIIDPAVAVAAATTVTAAAQPASTGVAHKRNAILLKCID